MSSVSSSQVKPFLVAGTSGVVDHLCTGTNDNVPLQAALDRLTSGGTLYIKEGTYSIGSANLNVPDNVTIMGAGYGTLINLSSGRSISVSGRSNVVIRNLRVDGSAQAINNQAISIANPNDVTVEGCWVLNCEGFGVFLSSTGGTETGKVRVIDCRLSGLGNNDVLGGGPTNATSDLSEIIVMGNHIRQDFSQGTYRPGIDIVSMNKTVISNNIIEGSLLLGGEKIPHLNVTVANNIIRPANGSTYTQLGVLTASNASETDDSQSINIIGNQITNGHIYVQGQSSTSSRTRKVNIKDNVIKGLASDPSTEVNWGIDLNYLADVQVAGNIVDGSDRGIYINGIAGIDVSNNRFINCNTGLVTNGTNTTMFGKNNVGINPDVLYAAGNVTGSTTFNRLNGETITGTLTGSITATLTSGSFPGDRLTLKLTQDGTGSRTITWPSNFKKAGGTLTLSTAAGATDVINAVYDGTNWLETSRSLNVS